MWDLMNWTVVLVGGILLIGLSRLHGKATLDGLKVWLKIDAIQRKIEVAAKAPRIAGKKHYPESSN